MGPVKCRKDLLCFSSERKEPALDYKGRFRIFRPYKCKDFFFWCRRCVKISRSFRAFWWFSLKWEKIIDFFWWDFYCGCRVSWIVKYWNVIENIIDNYNIIIVLIVNSFLLHPNEYIFLFLICDCIWHALNFFDTDCSSFIIKVYVYFIFFKITHIHIHKLDKSKLN